MRFYQVPHYSYKSAGACQSNLKTWECGPEYRDELGSYYRAEITGLQVSGVLLDDSRYCSLEVGVNPSSI